MALSTSSPPKPINLILVITLFSIFLLTACRSSPLLESPTPTSPPVEPPAQTILTPTASMVDESAPSGSRAPSLAVENESAPCPPQGNPEPLQDVPFNIRQDAILTFLNNGGRANELGDALYLAGIANLPQPTAAGDMDGDGKEEVVVSIFDPDSDSLPPAGMLLIFTCRDRAYHLAYQEDTRPSEGAPGIRYLQDLNKDGLEDLVVSSASCGAHTCFERVQVIQWDGEVYRNHLEGETTDLPFPTVYLAPTAQEGVYELEVSGSGFGSVGAGPQRNITRTWSYNDQTQLWQVSGFRQEPSPYRIHILHDAAAAAESGDYQQALLLYNQVISDTTLEDWVDPELEQAWIKAFARYQMAVIYTFLGREAFAKTVLEELQNSISEASPQSGYYHMAEAYMDGYQEGGAEMGCKLAQDYAALHSGLLDPLGADVFGYGNPGFANRDLCP